MLMFQGLAVLDLCIILIAVLVITWVMARRLMFSPFDSAWLVVLLTTFTLTLVIYEYWVNQSLAWSVVQFFIGAHVMFFLGANFTYFFMKSWRRKTFVNRRTLVVAPALIAQDAVLIRVFLFISTIFLLILLAFRASQLGLPIFSSDPELARVEGSRGGFGFMSRLSGPLIYVSLVLLFYARRVQIRISRWSQGFYFVLLMLPLIAAGSKSSLLIIFHAFFFANVYVSLREHKSMDFVSAKIVTAALFGLFGFSFVILYIGASASPSDDNSSPAIVQLLLRLIYTGSGPLYYFMADLTNKINFGWFDYFWNYLIVSFLAPLRLLPYADQTLGQSLGYLMTGSEYFGPNPTMYLEGWVFFGKVGGLLYCAVLGAIFAGLRYFVLFTNGRRNVFGVLLFSVANLLTLSITTDTLLFFGDLFNFLLVLTPLVIIWRLVAMAISTPNSDVLPTGYRSAKHQ
jgi:oligosaccharide repeat unit polymerase